MRNEPVAGVGVACFRGEAVLLIKRGKPPLLGAWSLPGGKIERGETAAAAALRELEEETSVIAALARLVDVVDILPGSAGDAHYVVIEFAARWLSGAPRAGDDATEARFFALSELDALGLTPETRRIIATARTLL